MTNPIAERLRQLLGPDGVEWSPDHVPRALPDSTEAAARICQLAFASGWHLRLEGRGHWLPADAPADLTLSSANIDQVAAVHAADLVATAGAGIPMDRLGARLQAAGTWLAIDAPGRPDRSLGSVVATGTAGALRHALGSVRDQVVGCTVVTGDGRIIKAGGRVTKNVAGYDLTKLQVGGFGGFGFITEVHLRLRALPETDLTLVAHGDRDPLTLLARTLESAGMDAACCELLSPAASAAAKWTLAIRLLGPDAAVRSEQQRLQQLAGPMAWRILEGTDGAQFWHAVAHAMGGGVVSFRLGVLAEGLDEVVDLLHHRMGTGLVAAGASRGGLRWSGTTDAETVRELRHLLAAREIPVTLERAPWELRHVVGHFGAYREGVGPLVEQLRTQFDPGALLKVSLSGQPGD